MRDFYRDFYFEHGPLTHVYAGGDNLDVGEYEIGFGATAGTVSLHAKACNCGEWSLSLFCGITLSGRWSAQACNYPARRLRIFRKRYTHGRAIVAQGFGTELRIVVPA